jgi:aminoglycoside 6'-N-acetyltransferase
MRLRPPVGGDAAAIAALLRTPEVAPWWHPEDDASIDAMLREAGTLIAEVDGRPMGVLLYDEENHPDYRRAGVDIALHPDLHGRGFGQEALRLIVDHLIGVRGHHRITIDPAAANTRAIRCYERVGFRPVGIMRQYERDPAGGWRDGLLMDLLAEEWKPAAGG